jgi:hypothetical protein
LFIFRLFWYLDPSVLTAVSVIGLIATLVDYLVPTLTASICHPENWTGNKEKKLEEICRDLAYSQTQAAAKWAMFYDMRHSRPKVVGSNHFFNIVFHLSCFFYTADSPGCYIRL